MNENVRSVMHACCKGSLGGTMDFPEVVRQLSAIGCEQYHADLHRREKTYYMPDGQSYVNPLPVDAEQIGPTFSTDQVVAALRAAKGPRGFAPAAAVGCGEANHAGRRAARVAATVDCGGRRSGGAAGDAERILHRQATTAAVDH